MLFYICVQVYSERPARLLWQVPAKDAEEGPHVHGRQVGHETESVPQKIQARQFFGKHSLSNNIGWETFCYSKCKKKFPTLEHGEPVQPLRVRFAHIKETEQSIFQQMEDITLK